MGRVRRKGHVAPEDRRKTRAPSDPGRAVRLGSVWSWVIVMASIALLLTYLILHRGPLWLLLGGSTSG